MPIAKGEANSDALPLFLFRGTHVETGMVLKMFITMLETHYYLKYNSKQIKSSQCSLNREKPTQTKSTLMYLDMIVQIVLLI